MKSQFLTLFALLLLIPAFARAEATWINVEKVCPIDGVKCPLLDMTGPPPPLSSQPGRLDALSSPFSEPNASYQCTKCGFAAFMKDFKPLDKETTRKVLSTLAAATEKPDQDRSYNMTEFSSRLEAAERLFPALGRNKDPEFLADFYRLKGYAYTRENKPEKAIAARQQALLITSSLAKDSSKAPRLKEYLVEMASLNHHLGRDAEALDQLNVAENLKYNHIALRESQNSQRDKELADTIVELRQAIQKSQNSSAPSSATGKNNQ